MTTSGPAAGRRREERAGTEGAGTEGAGTEGAGGSPRLVLVVGPPGDATVVVGRRCADLGFVVGGAGRGTDDARTLAEVREDLRATLDATPRVPVVWVEPANALLLPTLHRCVGDSVVVLAWRAPEATVAALAAEGVAPAHAVARWEACLVHALRGASGLPLLGIDLDRSPPTRGSLAEGLRGLGVVVPGAGDDEAEPEPEPDTEPETVAPASGSPELSTWIGAIRARLAPVLGAATGVHAAWEAPDDLAVGPTSEAILAAHRAARRASLDAVSAWAAAHEAQTAAQDAKAAVEREHRELVGPDPMHYRELRRELWRLRDELAGVVAGRAGHRTAWMRADAARLAAEARADDLRAQLDHLEPVRAEREEMLRSERWRVGGWVLGPFARLRRMMSRR